MTTIAADTKIALDVLQNSDIFKNSEVLKSYSRENTSTITVEIKGFTWVLCYVSNSTGVVHFPDCALAEDLDVVERDARSFIEPAGADRERFLSLTEEWMKGLRHGG